MKNEIQDLRNHLFATIEGLLADKNPLDIERAKAVAQVASVMIDSAKAETAYLEVTGTRSGTGFIPESKAPALTQVKK